MAGRVPVSRRNLFQDRRRVSLSVLGVAASLVLVLVLDGVFAGATRQVTAYIRNSPADAFVSQRDVRTMHMSVSALPQETVDRVTAVEGVAWAEGLHYTTSIVDTGTDAQLTYVFGYDTGTGRGGPLELTRGGPPGSGEVVVDDVIAQELGIAIGDTVHVLGEPFRVSGTSREGTNIVNTTVFITAEDFTRLRGDSVAYVLVGAIAGVSGSELAQRLAAAVDGVTVQTKGEFAREEGRIVRDMAADIMQIMTIVAFLVALAVIALTLFTATLAKTREYGVMKALGTTSTRLGLIVAAQAGWSVGLGLAIAIVLSTGIGAAIGALTPNVQVAMEVGSLVRTSLGTLVVGALASLLPLRRIIAVDPATAFRRL